MVPHYSTYVDATVKIADALGNVKPGPAPDLVQLQKTSTQALRNIAAWVQKNYANLALGGT
jgi:hypothetical protein